MNNTVAWLIAGSVVIVLARVLKLRTKQNRLNPVTIVVGSWALMFFLSASQIVRFKNVPVEAWFYLMGFASLLVLGAAIGMGLSSTSRRKNSANTRSAEVGVVDFTVSPEMLALTKLVLILGAVGVLSNLYSIFIGHPVDLTDIEKIRNPQFRDVVGTTTWADRLAYLTLPFAWMGLVLTVLFSERLKGRFRVLAIAFLVGLAVMGVMSLGRSIQLRIALFVFVALWVRRGMGLRAWPFKWTLSHRALAALLLVAGTWYFFIFVWSWRAGGINNVSVDVSSFHKDADESLLLQQLPRGTPTPVRGLINFTALYLTTIADNFASFYVDVNVEPYYGLWELQSLTSGLSKLGLPVKSGDQIVREVQRSYEAVGLQVGQWRSIGQEFIVDFGKPGALVVIFLNGTLIGFIYRKFRQGKPHFAMMLVFLIGWGTYGAWLSPYGYMELIIFVLCTGYVVVIEVLRARRRVPILHRPLQLPVNHVGPALR